MQNRPGVRAAGPLLALSCLLCACQPTVRIEPPDKPIVINMNIKIEQEVRIKVDKELDEVFEKNDKVF